MPGAAMQQTIRFGGGLCPRSELSTSQGSSNFCTMFWRTGLVWPSLLAKLDFRDLKARGLCSGAARACGVGLTHFFSSFLGMPGPRFCHPNLLDGFWRAGIPEVGTSDLRANLWHHGDAYDCSDELSDVVLRRIVVQSLLLKRSHSLWSALRDYGEVERALSVQIESGL